MSSKPHPHAHDEGDNDEHDVPLGRLTPRGEIVDLRERRATVSPSVRQVTRAYAYVLVLKMRCQQADRSPKAGPQTPWRQRVLSQQGSGMVSRVINQM